MTDTTATRLGANDQGADKSALFLKRFSGMVMVEFAEWNVAMQRTMVRTIDSGRSAQFPIIGPATAAYHTPGENILDPTNSLLSNIRIGEKTIAIDKLLTSNVFVDRLDELLNHYETRMYFARKMAESLANQADNRIFQSIIAGTAASASYDGGPTGADFNPADWGGTERDSIGGVLGDDIVESLFYMKQVFDEKHVPMSERYAALPPVYYNRLIAEANDTVIDVDVNPGGNGSVADGIVKKCAGFVLLETNHIDHTATAAVETGNTYKRDGASGDAINEYDYDPEAVMFVAWQREAVGTVKLRDLTTEMTYLPQYKGTLLSADYAMGHGLLRPECCGIARRRDVATPDA